MSRRKRYLIKKNFQARMMVGVLCIVLVTIILSGILSYFVAVSIEKKSDIQFYGTTGGSVNDMIVISSSFIVKPVIIRALILSGVLSVVIAVIFTLLYSHRLAGPIYRMEKHLNEMINGNYDVKLKFREDDEFKNLADMINKLQDNLKESL